jgi:DNA polymerase
VNVVRLAHDLDFEGFRRAARDALARGAPPETTRFLAPAGSDADLFASREPMEPAACAAVEAAGFVTRVPRRFLALADLVSRHRAPERYDMLYRALWRLRETPSLLERAADPLTRRLEEMAARVSRDRAKMIAFVRFRKCDAPDGPRFVAWFEPDHFVEELAAPFFVDRFAAMRFAILTPRASVLWDGALTFGPGARREDVPAEDGFSSGWETYYRAIFNPARLASGAMRAQMPKKYWRNLPETRAIPEMVAQASRPPNFQVSRSAREISEPSTLNALKP